LTVSEPDDRLAVDHLEPDEREPEAAAEDVAEQVHLADPDEESDEPIHIALEASEWDSIEQARMVPIEDDYRDL
jgi:hypothetical protein